MALFPIGNFDKNVQLLSVFEIFLNNEHDDIRIN